MPAIDRESLRLECCATNVDTHPTLHENHQHQHRLQLQHSLHDPRMYMCAVPHAVFLMLSETMQRASINQ